MLARPANEVRTTSGGKEKAAKYCPRGGAFRNPINNSHEQNRANKTSRRRKKKERHAKNDVGHHPFHDKFRENSISEEYRTWMQR